MKRSLVVLTVLLSFIAVLSFSQSLAFIKVEGNTNVSTDFILSKLSNAGVRAGAEVDRNTLYNALQGLYDTGYFSYIEPQMQQSLVGEGLVVKVTENPVVKSVTVSINGPDLVGNDKVKGAVALKAGSVLNLNDLKTSFQSIIKLYTDAGYIPNVVGIKTNIVQKDNSIEIPNGDLVITVDEYAIWNLKLEGDYGKLTAKEIVKDTGLFTLKDYESMNAFFQFFADSNQAYPKFSEIQTFQAKLAQLGYFSPQTSLSFENATAASKAVGKPAVTLVVKASLNHVIDSGLPVNQYFFSGVTEVNPFSLAKYAGIQASSTTDNFEQLSQLAKIRSYYESKGYLLTGAYLKYYKYQAISKNGVLEYRVLQRHIGKINIVGNDKTQKYLIERELQFKPGDPVTAQKFVQSYNNLRNTGFFSDISIVPSLPSTDSTAVDATVKVVENDKPRQIGGSLTIGQPKEGEPWYSGIIASGSLGISNWAGYGQTLNSQINISENSSAAINYSVIFPFNLPLNFKSSLYYTTNELFNVVDNQNLYYDEKDMGGSASVGYQPDVYTSFNVGGNYYLFNRSAVSTPVDFGATDGTARVLNFDLNYTNVDNIMAPMKGIRMDLSGDIAGFGGTENYMTGTAMVAGYFPIMDNLSLAGRVLVGMAQGKDFYVGGANTVRGWSPREGNQEFVSNLSLRYAIQSSSLPVILSAFYDWGGAKDNLLYNGNIYTDFMNTVGVGISLDIPYLGVLRFDFPFKATFGGGLEYSGMTFGIGQMF